MLCSINVHGDTYWGYATPTSEIADMYGNYNSSLTFNCPNFKIKDWIGIAINGGINRDDLQTLVFIRKNYTFKYFDNNAIITECTYLPTIELYENKVIFKYKTTRWSFGNNTSGKQFQWLYCCFEEEQ